MTWPIYIHTQASAMILVPFEQRVFKNVNIQICMQSFISHQTHYSSATLGRLALCVYGSYLVRWFMVDTHRHSQDDVNKWKHLPRYWPFVQGIHRPPVNSPHKGQWRRALMFSLICVSINAWVNNREAGDLRRYRAPYDVTVMLASSIYFAKAFTGT